MEKNTKQSALFTEVSGKKVDVDFDGGEVTSDAGLLFLREVEKRIGVIRRVSEAVHDNRHPGYVRHEMELLFMQRVFQIIAGYEDGNDCNDLRNDSIMKISCDKRPISDLPLASQPTMSRFENAPSARELYQIARTLVDVFIDSYDSPPKGIIIDIDDTDTPTYGAQQMTLFNNYHHNHCYMPMHIYEGTSGKLIAAILRPGKRPSGREIVSIVKRIVKRIRDSWSDVGIILRGDAHYSCPEVHAWCEGNNVKFVLGQTPNTILYDKASAIMANAEELYALNKKPVKLFGEVTYKAASWSSPRRVIVKAEHTEKGANTRFIVTNLRHSTARFIYQDIYCGRGQMELYIKEHKNHLFSSRASCHSFAANQFRLFLHSIAYVLLHTFRSRYLVGTAYVRAQFDTIRLKFLKVGARVRELFTKVKIHLPSSYPLKNEFFIIWRSCCERAPT
jgi:hypothetical protein